MNSLQSTSGQIASSALAEQRNRVLRNTYWHANR